MKPESINTQSLKKCHTLYCNYISPYSESAWKQLFDEDIYTASENISFQAWDSIVPSVSLSIP